jgi:endonuclease YncB( thermonuclease family)
MHLQRWLTLALIFFASTGAVLADELFGRASVIDGDTLEIHGARIRLWGIVMRQRPISFAVIKAANTIAVGRRPP